MVRSVSVVAVVRSVSGAARSVMPCSVLTACLLAHAAFAAEPKNLIAYKHTSKTGGIYLERVLPTIFGKRYIRYGESPRMTRNLSHFLIGSVREPCSWLVSFWGFSWRQSCRHMYDLAPCALSNAEANWASDEYWKSPGACLSLQAVKSCAQQALAACMRRWAGANELASEVHFTRPYQALPPATVDAFALALTDGGRRLNASRMVELCPDAGPRPWISSAADFAQFAHLQGLNYESIIMRPFFEQVKARKCLEQLPMLP